MTQSGLFGIIHSNRKEEDHWGKNCFNSSFPTSMACYMMSQKIPAVYLRLNEKMQVVAETISIEELFKCQGKTFDELSFQFESVYEPYQKYSFDPIDGIDLVVKDTEGHFLAPLEIKLTVIPDNTTFKKAEEKWGAEIVYRSPTTLYCALGMFDGVAKEASHIREIFEPICGEIEKWDSEYEMKDRTPYLRQAIDTFEMEYLSHQKPLVMQTLWKTQGKSPVLAENAFDIVVWSDYAFSRLFVDKVSNKAKRMSRPARATARIARCLWELSKSGKIRVNDIYRQMSFGTQTDKEANIQGVQWIKYAKHDRVLTPILSKYTISDIIQEGFIEKLSPERRFDQTLYFTVRN